MSNSLVFFLVNIGFVLFQIFLSKRENKWLGLVLPGINVMFSIIGVLGMAFFKNEPIISSIPIIVQIIMIFLLLNIPTIILIAIYFACRKKIKRNKEIDKMNIQDL